MHRVFWWGNVEGDQLEDRCLDEKMIILKWMLRKEDVRACSRLFCLTIRTSFVRI
jgi:hypothetical protein